jgi:hypothetical protein
MIEGSINQFDASFSIPDIIIFFMNIVNDPKEGEEQAKSGKNDGKP